MKIANLNQPHLYLAPRRGWPRGITPSFWHQKKESLGYRIRRCLRDPTFSRFRIVPAYDGRTDGQTNRQTNGQTHDDSIYRASIASRGKSVTALYGCPAAIAARVLRAILPDLVFGRRGTTITSLKLATGPTCSRTFAITSLTRLVRPISVSGTSINKTLCYSRLYTRNALNF